MSSSLAVTSLKTPLQPYFSARECLEILSRSLTHWPQSFFPVIPAPKSLVFFSHGSTTVIGLGLVYEVPRSHSDTTKSLGLLSRSDRPVAETTTWQHTKLTIEDIHAPGGIPTPNTGKRGTVDLRLTPRGHRDRVGKGKVLPRTGHEGPERE